MRRQLTPRRARVRRGIGMALICGALAPVTAAAQTAAPSASAAQPASGASPAAASPPTAVKFYGSPSSPISAGVVIPPNAAFLWTSGTVPPVVDKQAKPDDRARYGDTKTQAIGILKAFEQQLAPHGLTLKDVVYLRAYLVPDAAKDGKIDTDGWNEAYKQYFGTEANPTKVARSTVGVAALVNPAWLIEIEAFAVFPVK